MGCFNEKCIRLIRTLPFVLIFCCVGVYAQSFDIVYYNVQSSYSANKKEIFAHVARVFDDFDQNEMVKLIEQIEPQTKPHYFLQCAKYLWIKKKVANCEFYLDKTVLYVDTTIMEHDYILADYHFYRGKIAASKSDGAQVIDHFESAAKCYKLRNDLNSLSLSYLEIANYFSKRNNIRYADKYYDLALHATLGGVDKKIDQLFKLNYANHLFKEGKCDRALIHYKRLENDSVNQSRSRLGMVKNNIGVILLKQNRNQLAYQYLSDSYKIKKDLNDKTQLFNCLNNLFYLSNELDRIDRSLLHKQELEKILPYSDDSSLITSYAYNCLIYELKVIGKPKLIKSLRDYVAQKKSLSEAIFSDKLIEMQKGFELKEKDNEIAILQKEDALNQSRIRNRNILLGVITGFALVLAIIVYFVIRQRRELRASRQRLLRQKEDITGMNDQLRVSNLSKDRILSVIGHDLRGPVGGLKELIELYMELPEYEPEDIENLLKAARESSTSTYHLLENLLSWANSQRGDIVFSPVATPLAPLIKQSVNLLDKSINTRNVKFTYDMPKALVVQADMNMLRTVIRNLVSNALKYSPENGSINIVVSEVNGGVQMSICDQGRGMTAEETQRIFSKKEQYFIGSDMSAKGTGLGLILCKEFVERHHGRIWIDSEQGQGTNVCFTIPQKSVVNAPTVSVPASVVQ
ncbi:HAMP domain-containing histidine kinase [Carboxylicivirga sp. M1479]|nr:HAMP domain-containing histidine kinase [Carboxylicivirga sp. M1479]